MHVIPTLSDEECIIRIDERLARRRFVSLEVAEVGLGRGTRSRCVSETACGTCYRAAGNGRDPTGDKEHVLGHGHTPLLVDLRFHAALLLVIVCNTILLCTYKNRTRGGTAARKSKATFLHTFVLVVVVEAFAALLAQPLSVHHALQ